MYYKTCSLTLLTFLLFSAIQHKYTDWKDFLVKRLTGARTLPQNFYNKVQENIHDHPIRKSVKVEVVDKNCVSAMRVATVEETIGGRLHLIYEESKPAVSTLYLYSFCIFN